MTSYYFGRLGHDLWKRRYFYRCCFFILFFHPEHNKSAIRFHYVNEKADDSDRNLDG